MRDKLLAIWDRFAFAVARFVVGICERLDIELGSDDVKSTSVVVACPCGQKNRVRSADFNRRPICGKCKRMLRLPS